MFAVDGQKEEEEEEEEDNLIDGILERYYDSDSDCSTLSPLVIRYYSSDEFIRIQSITKKLDQLLSPVNIRNEIITNIRNYYNIEHKLSNNSQNTLKTKTRLKYLNESFPGIKISPSLITKRKDNEPTYE